MFLCLMYNSCVLLSCSLLGLFGSLYWAGVLMIDGVVDAMMINKSFLSLLFLYALADVGDDLLGLRTQCSI